MQIDKRKQQRQLEGVFKWADNKYKGILDWHTGVGKTYGTELGIKYLEATLGKHSYLIIVPSAPLETQWKEKLAHLPKNLLERITIKTIDKILNEDLVYEVNVLIIDEIHEFTTEKRLDVLNGLIVKYDKILGLTASTDDKNFKKILKHVKVVDVISAEEAKREKFVADVIEYNVALVLSENEQITYDKLTETISKLMPRFDNNLQLANCVLTGGKHTNGMYYAGPKWAQGIAAKNGWHPRLDLSIESHQLVNSLWNPNHIIGYARSLINSIRARKDLLCNANSKYNATLEIAKKFNKVKTILFSESTTFADKIGIILNANNQPTVVFHSKLKLKIGTSPKTGKPLKKGITRQKNEALSEIRSGKSRILSTAKSFDRGLDVPDLRLSVTTSGSSSTTQKKQRDGRTGRREESIHADVPVLNINLYIKDTVDEKWLESRQSKSENKPITVNSVADITYTPAPNKEFTFADM